MDKLFVFDTNENLLVILQNKDGSNTCPHYDTTVTEQLNGEYLLEFTTLMNHKDARHVVEGNKIGIWDQDQQFQLFEITFVDDDRGESTATKSVICEHSMIVELNDDIVRDKRPANVTIDVALSGILSDTVKGGMRWNVGNVAPLGTATPENIYFETPMSGVQKIIKAFQTDYKPRFTINQNKIVGRFIDPGPRGTDNGRRFEYTKDLKQIKREVDTTALKTALIGRGRGEEIIGDDGFPTGGFGRRIDFSNVTWIKSNGDPADKPSGQDWVGDPEALALFGPGNGSGGKEHKVGLFEDIDEEDPAVLLRKTWDYLQTINGPRLTYTMTVVDLAELTGSNHQKVKLGDTVTIIDREFVPALTVKARIIEIKRKNGEPENTEITMGNFRPLFTDETSKIEAIERRINERSGVWESAPGPITNDDFKDITPKAPANVVANGIFRTITVNWLLETDVSIGQYEVFASKVSNFTPGPTNLVWRGYAGGYVHDAEVNEQWFFRVRVVNKRGTPGPYSPQVTATTIQIIPDDFEQSKIPEFLDVAIIKQGTTPTGTFVTGQLWIDTSKTPNVLNRWTGSAWVKLTPTAPGEVGAETAIFKQTTAPAHLVGRLWIDTSNSLNVLYRSTGTTWQKLTPTTPGEVGAETAILKQATAPAHSVGRLWLDTSKTPNILYRSTGSAWIKGTPTTAGEVGAYTFSEVDTALNAKAEKTVVDTLSGTVTSHETRIEQTEKDIALKASQSSVDTLSGKVSTAETNISANATAIALRATKSEFDTLAGRVSTAEASITAQAGEIALRVTTSTYNSGMATKENNVTKSNTAPSSPTTNQLWLNTSVTPNVLNRWSGSAWVKATPTTASEVGAYSSTAGNALAGRMTTAETSITANTNEIALKATKSEVDTLAGRVSTAESSITANTTAIALRATKSEFDTLAGRVSTAEASITAQAGQIALRVTKTEFDNLQIGGRNLLKDSEVIPIFSNNNTTSPIITNVLSEGGIKFTRVTVSPGSSTGQISTYENIRTEQITRRNLKGEKLIASVKVRTSSPGRTFNHTPYILRQNGTRIDPDYVNVFTSNGNWQTFYFVFNNLPEDITSASYVFLRYVLRVNGDMFGEHLDVRGYKLELGNHATDWTPAPEDIDGQIDTLSGRVSTAEASITAQAGQIALRVEKNGVISSINQSPEAITISASKINIDGDLTVTNGLVRVKQGIITNTMIASNAQIDFAKIANVQITNAMISGQLDASKINATSLSAISANLGNVTAGNLTSNTTIDVTTNLTVGQNITLGKSRGVNEYRTLRFGGETQAPRIDGYVANNYEGSELHYGAHRHYFSGNYFQFDRNEYIMERYDQNHGGVTGIWRTTFGVHQFDQNHQSSANGTALNLLNTELARITSKYIPGNVDVAKIAITNYNTAGTGWFTTVDRYKAGFNFYTRDGGPDLIRALEIRSDGVTVVHESLQFANTSGIILTRFGNFQGKTTSASNANWSFLDSEGNRIFEINYGPGTNKDVKVYNDLTMANSSNGTGGLSFNTANVVTVDMGYSSSAFVNMYIRPKSNGEVRCTASGSTTVYVPLRASNVAVSSSAKYKTNIKMFDPDNIINLLKDTHVYSYHLINDVENGIYDKQRIGFISETVNPLMRDEDGIDHYTVTALLWQVVKEQQKTIEKTEKRLEDLEMIVYSLIS